MNLKRSRVRNLKRQGARQRANKLVKRSRPIIRPKAPPKRVMARRNLKASEKKMSRRPRRVGPPPSPRMERRAGGGLGVGVTAAAVAAGAFLALKTNSAHPDIYSDVSSLEYSLGELEERAGFSELEADISSLDSTLNHALNLLESAREKGYRYEKDLEEIAYDAMNRWQEIRDGVRRDVQQQADLMRGNISAMDAHIQRLNNVLDNPSAAMPILGDTQNEINRFMGSIRDAENNIEGAYSDIEAKAGGLNTRLTRIHWMLTQLEEASFELDKDEDMVRAVVARWDYEGKDDPEGLLFLTNQRLIFERKEKVATKKVLFITTASELVQKMMISQKLANIQENKAHSKGLFGHHDFLEAVFADAKIGKISFHLNGQDSEEWARLIRDAKSGKIEEDRTTGAGLSFSDLTGALTAADIVELQGEVNELQDEMMLQDTRREISELENEVHSLERDISELRSRGYAVEKSLEADIQVLTSQWVRIKGRAETTLEHQTRLLSEQMSAIQSKMGELAGLTDKAAAARPLFIQLKSAIASAEAQAEAAEDTVLDQYDEYADEVESLSAHFDWIDWMLDAISTASFKLLATESGVAAVEATWEPPGLEPENGILFLTDQRILWEEREGNFELKIEAAVQQIVDVKESKDETSGDEYLTVEIESDAPVRKAHFE
ncbi:MAG: hypothetical protein FVQ83_08690 [Chloroflexi bacterium]|nr:hypothetical protein [Chloroflexota bacterium]